MRFESDKTALTEQRSYNIQLLRGIAIIAVVCIHNCPGGLEQVFVRPFLNFGTALFLFLSGYLSHAGSVSPWKRIEKVAIPYFWWSAIYSVIVIHNRLITIAVEFTVSLVTARAAAVMYYVFIYAELTLLIPVVDHIGRSKYKWLGFVITPAEIVLMRLVPMVMRISLNKIWDILIPISCLGWFTYYYLGYLIGNSLIKLTLSKRKVFVLWTVAMCSQLLEGYWQFTMGVANFGTQLKLSAIFSGTFFCIRALYFIVENTKQVKWLKLVGDLSFGIFFSHLAVMDGLSMIPHYSELFFIIKVILVIITNVVLILIGRKILGSYSWWLAL